MNSKNFLITSQLPNKFPFQLEASYLFKSLTEFGGKLSESKKVACFSESPDDVTKQLFEENNISIKLITDLNIDYPHANKIQMLDLNKNEDFDYMICLDTDILVTKDFSEFINGDEIKLKPVDDDPLNLNQWSRLYANFGLTLPKKRFLTSLYNKETIPYFNSGVIIIPKKFVVKLFDKWSYYVKNLPTAYEQLPDIKKHSFFTDQFALSLAIEDTKIPYSALPLEMNFPTHIPTHSNFKPEQCIPFLIHYHHMLDNNNKIKHCLYPNTNILIEKVNKKLFFS